MLKYPVKPVTGSKNYIPYDWEILDSFFKNHDIVPAWINCHYTWGWYDEESGKWTGAVGKVKQSIYIYIILASTRLKMTRQTWLFLVFPVPMPGLRCPSVCLV